MLRILNTLSRVAFLFLCVFFVFDASSVLVAASASSGPPSGTPPGSGQPGSTQSTSKRNFLFIAIDDLRPELGGYGFPNRQTPNIDAFLADSARFHRAYASGSFCAPSRAAWLTGRRPDMNFVMTTENFRTMGCNVSSLPQYFKDRGYRVAGMGKIFHNNGWATNYDNDGSDPISWNVPYYNAKDSYKTSQVSWASKNVSETNFGDYMLATRAIEELTAAKKDDRPFFTMVGLIKPHLPLVLPQKYFDRMSVFSPNIALDGLPPTSWPSIARTYNGELRTYGDIKAMNCCDNFQRLPIGLDINLRQAYRAAVAFIDVQVGRVLNALDQLELANSTTVVFWSDHGFHLGEHGIWGKHTLFENDCRVPFAIRAPWISNRRRAGVMDIVESIDIFPTLTHLAGWPKPAGLQGRSLVSLLSQPTPAQNASTTAALTQEIRGGSIMGYSLRTNNWRYTEWVKYDNVTRTPLWNQVANRELYDHRGDDGRSFEAWENDNLIADPEYASLADNLRSQLRNMVNQAVRPAGSQCIKS